MSQFWNSFRDMFITALDFLHGWLSFVGDEPAWGWAIVALTLIVRILLLPLAIKQTRSMRAMQQLQPKIKAIQKKYKADRDLLKKDPERYKAQRQKMNEEMTALYQEAGVNPAGGCLPLLAQAPIFIALFSVLRAPMDDHPAGTALGDLLRSDFYFFTPDATGLSTAASSSGVWGVVLIVLMAASMFWSQRQMMSRTSATADSAQLQQQKILMYVMPGFLAVISFNFPMGVLLYWVTTNIWQIVQQAIILYEVDHEAPPENGGNGASATTPEKPSAGSKPSGKGPTRADGKGPSRSSDNGSSKGSGKGSGKGSSKGSGKGTSTSPNKSPDKGSSKGPSKGSPNGKPSRQRRAGNGGTPSKGSPGHIPSRRSRRERE